MPEDNTMFEVRWVPGQPYEAAVDGTYKPMLVTPWEFIPTMLLAAGGFWWNGEAAGVACAVLAVISLGLPVWAAVHRSRSDVYRVALARCDYFKSPACWALRAVWDNMEPALKATGLCGVESVPQGRDANGKPIDPVKRIIYPTVRVLSADPPREVSLLFDTTRDSTVAGPAIKKQAEALLSRLGLNTWYIQPSTSPDPRCFVVTFGVRKGSIDERYRGR